MLKAGRTVVLHEKVREPGQAVRNDKRDRDPPPVTIGKSENKNKPARKRPYQMNRPRSLLAVGLHIFGPEIRKGRFAVHAAKLITGQ